MTYQSTTDPIADDIRLVAARRMIWDKDAWRRPGMLALLTRSMQDIVDSDDEPDIARTEAKMLIKKLYLAGKRPPDIY